jgi:hypothetical protein
MSAKKDTGCQISGGWAILPLVCFGASLSVSSENSGFGTRGSIFKDN